MRCIPEGLPRPQLLDIARLVDRYEMQNSLGAFLELWIKNSFHMTYAVNDEESALDWLYIMFVFDHYYYFSAVASHLMWFSTGIDLEDAPEGFQSVLNEISGARDYYLRPRLNAIHREYKAYVGGTKCQSSTCTTQEFVVGFFTRLLEKYKILSPPQPSYRGLRLIAVFRFLTEFQEGLQEAPPCLVGNCHYCDIDQNPEFDPSKLFHIEDFKPGRPLALIPFRRP
ncbi:hypothetical protein EMPG_09242 [Blastomyces silverae]|uniref:Uncharacterized protein n=1 Tax=Blastomyces silverae TaxID=2060906 RepID=A0A0H1BI85_9EURO|nr:hypothetical protein EMPG_09242 [Blastomyces silverae]